MSYATYEASTQDGDPEYRFLFITGTTEFRYTTTPYIVGDSGGSWLPIQIDGGKLTQSGEMAKDSLKIKLPRDNALAITFLGGVPEQITSVTVFRGHVSDVAEEYLVYWKGRVAGVSIGGDVVSLECENIFTSMRRPGLRAKYQKTCRHGIFERGCNINDYDYAVVGTATAVSDSVLTIEEAGDSNIDYQYFRGGTLETADGFKRYITAHDGTSITLVRPIQALTDDINGSNGQATVTLYPGCDHTRTTCAAKFNNLDNFGGFAFMPSKNPFKNGVGGSIV